MSACCADRPAARYNSHRARRVSSRNSKSISLLLFDLFMWVGLSVPLYQARGENNNTTASRLTVAVGRRSLLRTSMTSHHRSGRTDPTTTCFFIVRNDGSCWITRFSAMPFIWNPLHLIATIPKVKPYLYPRSLFYRPDVHRVRMRGSAFFGLRRNILPKINEIHFFICAVIKESYFRTQADTVHLCIDAI